MQAAVYENESGCWEVAVGRRILGEFGDYHDALLRADEFNDEPIDELEISRIYNRWNPRAKTKKVKNTGDIRKLLFETYGERMRGQEVSNMSDSQIIAIYHSMSSK